MFCGKIFTNTDLQNHKKNHMKKSPKRFHRVNRASFLSLSNEFEDQKLIPKISPKKFWSAPCFPQIVCGGQCGGKAEGVAGEFMPWHLAKDGADSLQVENQKE